MKKNTFTFVDLFSGIGGFHAVLSAMGGKCVFASELQSAAASVYHRNWGFNPIGDITKDANDAVMNVPPHDVLAAGFPCQPFSKGGAQLGMEETRGTLFWNILKIVQAHHPKIIILENVRNLAGPRHHHEWKVIIKSLRDQGYRVSDRPTVFSPHLLPPELGGKPQFRERIFITATYIGAQLHADDFSAEPPVENKPVDDWNPKSWSLENHLPLESVSDTQKLQLSDIEKLWINAWDEFVSLMRQARGNKCLPGFPLWADSWVHSSKFSVPDETPHWKSVILKKNADFYNNHQHLVDAWTEKWHLYSDSFPSSKRKLEWQAQEIPSIWQTIIQFRPSGIRVRPPTYVPALVAITQTSIWGPQQRRLSIREAARLQGIPEWFDFGTQPDSSTFRQLGNGVSIGAVWYVLKAHALRDHDILKLTAPKLLRSIRSAPADPNEAQSERK
jgi:DNA (cytosine-5)-methyltransferase 1